MAVIAMTMTMHFIIWHLHRGGANIGVGGPPQLRVDQEFSQELEALVQYSQQKAANHGRDQTWRREYIIFLAANPGNLTSQC